MKIYFYNCLEKQIVWKKIGDYTFNTGVKYSATPNAVPFTEFITLCIIDKFV